MKVLRVLGNRILLRHLGSFEPEGAIAIPPAYRQKTNEFRVVAVGTGRVQKDGTRTTEDFCGLQPGDTILIMQYGGLPCGYQFKVDGEEYLLVGVETLRFKVMPDGLQVLGPRVMFEATEEKLPGQHHIIIPDVARKRPTTGVVRKVGQKVAPDLNPGTEIIVTTKGLGIITLNGKPFRVAEAAEVLATVKPSNRKKA